MKNFLLLVLFTAVLVSAQYDTPSEEYTDQTDYYSSSDDSDTYGICWMHTYGRVGESTVNSCAEGQSIINSLCYKSCKHGYSPNTASDTGSEDEYDSEGTDGPPVAKTFCWEDCPAGLSNFGEGCGIPGPFGASDSTDNEDNCLAKNPQGCEFCDGLAWYPKSDCGSCANLCPVTCPKGMVEHDRLCNKHFYNRTAVDSLFCAPGLEIVNATCYTPAEEGFNCDNQFCWGLCPSNWTRYGVMCVNEKHVGDGILMEFAEGTYDTMAKMANALTDPSQGDTIIVQNVPGIAPYLKYPMCH